MMKIITAGIASVRQAIFQRRDVTDDLRLIVDQVPANIAYFDTDLRYVFVNKAVEDIYETPKQDIVGKHINEIQSPSAYKENLPHLKAALRGDSVTFERALTLPNGTVRNYQSTYLPHFDEHGQVIGCYVVSVNISARVVAEHKLQQETANRLRLITDNLPAWIAYTDVDQRYRFVNKTCADWYLRPAEEIIGKTVSELTGRNYEKLRPYIETVLEGEQVTFVEDFSYPDGVTRNVQVNYIPHFGAGGSVEGYFSLIEDFSALQHAEARLRQSLKMEAIGQLTGGVAHDFNNLLAVITSNAELLGDMFGENQLLTTIERAATRGGELTARLLAFSRQQELQPQAVDLKIFIPGLLDLLGRTLGEQIRILVDVPVDIWPVFADPGQLDNALLNLSINARDAMPAGGTLEIECSNIELRTGDMRLGDEFKAGSYVQITVRDTGVGMSEATLEHAFEPFYTTKGVGEGSGLGLSMVYGFAKQSGGDVVIRSDPHKGVEVRIFLPRANAAMPSDEQMQKINVKQAQGETILVLEDDPDVRDSTVLVLEGLGYRVFQAADANAALLVLAAEADNIDLLLSDVVLPGGVSGPVVAAQAKKLYPNLKVVFMSGYAADLYVNGEDQGSNDTILTKPIRRADLNKAIQATLAT